MRAIWLISFIGVLLAAPAHALAPAPEPVRSESGARPLSAATSYVQMDPVITAVHHGSGVSGLLHVEMSLDVPDARLRARITERMARLRDAYITAMSGYAGLAYRRGEVPDTARITELLQRSTDAVLGETGAQVLLSMVIIHER